MPVRIDSADCQDFASACSREWLVTNGLGGYASGTVSGANTRRYHGLLVAALKPPAERIVLLAGLEEWLLVEGSEPVPLSAQEYWDGTVYPQGFRALDGVDLDGMMPVFSWRIGSRTIEKRIRMEQDANRTLISYRLRGGGAPVRLRLRPLFAHRDYHTQRRGPGSFTLAESSEGWAVEAGGVRSHLQVRPAPSIQSQPDWYWRVLHRAERERGLDDEEDLFTPGTIEGDLMEGAELSLIVGTDPVPAGWRLGEAAVSSNGGSGLVAQLTAAAGQFLVARDTVEPAAGGSRSIIAGYHWFVDWGRDTTVSLPGLTLATGNPGEARRILATLMQYLDHGLLPNRFPDQGDAVEYNTMDATFWLFQAIHAYLEATGDWDFITERLSSLEEIIDWHLAGTHHGIKVDPKDGLLAGGEEGFALTWMDARVGDWVVTPRRGKPIEINALWFNALQLTADWCARTQRPSLRYRQMALQAQQSATERFWDEGSGYLFDVVDGPEGEDSSLRPNQLVALGLAYPLIEGQHATSALEQVSHRLLTPFGLRTLSPDDPRYQARYTGDQRQRDAAYHMGTVWPWLLGPYIDAVKRLHADPVPVETLLAPFEHHLSAAGLGTISEIFEPEPPFRPAGCIAQAWSVAEILRHAVSSGGEGR